MEPVRSWSSAQAAAWLRGLDAAVQGYPFEAWGLAGPDLLALDAGVLEALGVRPLGHQELLLEAAEQLRNLDTGLASTSLRTLTERLQELAQGIPSLVQAGLSAGDGPQPPSLTLLARVIDLVGAAKELFSWLNRYLFSTLNDFSASRDIILLCAQLAETLQADLPAAERSSGILQICQHIVGICESIVGCSPPALLDRRAVLQRVGLALLPAPQGSPPTSPSTPTLPLGLRQSPPTSPDTPTLPPSQRSSPPGSPGTPTAPSDLVGSPQSLLTARLGFEITSTSSCLHFVSATTPEALAAHGDHILPGDEIVQVNEQVVVGWTPVNLARKLLEKGNEVTLVLKKIPLNLPGTPHSPRQQPPGAFLDAADSPGTRSGESPGSPVSLTSSVAADLDSGPDSVPDPGTDEEQEEAGRDLRLPQAAVEELPGPSGQGAAEEVWDSGSPLGTPLDTPLGTPPSTPAATEPCATELSPRAAPATGAGGAEPSPEEGSLSTGRRPKGVATRLSRRRVSCRDLGRVDCDGWLLKKKEHVGFMAQKWKRCWCVLKGHTLYWYNHPNDERAAGLINVATYNLESTREQKKKYVFQLCHQTYKPFVFAAETLADLSMWVGRLVTAKTKYTLAHQAVPDKEEDCYSETEAEDPDDETPRHGSDSPRKRLQNPAEKAQLSPASSPQGSPRPCSPMVPKAGLDGAWSTLGQWEMSLPWQRWNKMIFKVPSEPNHCTIPRLCGRAMHGGAPRGLGAALVLQCPLSSPRARRGGPGEPGAVPEAGRGVPDGAAAGPDAGAVPKVLPAAQQEPAHQREGARRAGPAEHAQGEAGGAAGAGAAAGRGRAHLGHLQALEGGAPGAVPGAAGGLGRAAGPGPAAGRCWRAAQPARRAGGALTPARARRGALPAGLGARFEQSCVPQHGIFWKAQPPPRRGSGSLSDES